MICENDSFESLNNTSIFTTHSLKNILFLPLDIMNKMFRLVTSNRGQQQEAGFSIKTLNLISWHILQVHRQVNVVRDKILCQLSDLIHHEGGLRTGNNEGAFQNDPREKTSIPQNRSVKRWSDQSYLVAMNFTKPSTFGYCYKNIS